MTGRNGPGKRQAGVTLAEMLTVVAVLAVTAAIALPKADPNTAFAADAAAAEVARAIRFAQREAIRTGTWQQVSADPVKQELRVYQASNNATATHPVDKREYKISFAGNAMPRATIVSSVFKYDSGPAPNYVSFGPDGAPAYIDPLKEEGKITIRYGNAERVVRVAPVTGRVTF